MRFLFRPASAWVLCNVVGVAGYLSLAATLWVRSGEEGVPGGPGDGFYWLAYLVPMLMLFLALNAVAFLLVARQVKQTGHKGALVIWLVVAMLWVGTVARDQYKSSRHVELPFDLP